MEILAEHVFKCFNKLHWLHLVHSHGHLVHSHGYLVHNHGHLVHSHGHLVHSHGHLVHSHGHFHIVFYLPLFPIWNEINLSSLNQNESFCNTLR